MKRFDLLLSEAMDITIMRIFGKSASEWIYRSAERHVSLKREEVGEKIEAFCAYLEKLLGAERAQIIHAASLKRLCLRLEQEYEEIETHFSLLDDLYKIKFKLLTASCEEERSACN
jgi:hypothetical protein